MNMEGKYLITTDNWFYAPDGKEYRAAWGDVEIIEDSVLGVKTNRNSSNWFARVGSEQNHILIAGCQIHYAIRCDERPHGDRAGAWTTNKAGACVEFERPTIIYMAE